MRTSRGPPEAAQDPSRDFQVTSILQNGKKTMVLNDLETVLDMLGELPNVAKGSSMPPSHPQRAHSPPKEGPKTAQDESEVPKLGSYKARGITKCDSG